MKTKMKTHTAAYGLLGKQTKKNSKAGAPRRKHPSFSSAKKHPTRLGLGLLSCLSWLVALVLGSFVLAGCSSTLGAVQSLHFAEFSTNKTYDVQLRVGYFGGCVSIANTTKGPSISAQGSSKTAQISCVPNMRGGEIDDVGEELWEDMTLTHDAEATLKTYLNEILPAARRLQEQVFPWYAPLAHLILFLISGCLLFATATNLTGKRSYKAILVAAVLLGAFALALVYVSAVGSVYALNGLVYQDGVNDSQLPAEVVFSRGSRLHYVELAQLVLVSLYYVFMGGMFVQG